MSESSNDQPVGYGRPPISSRFQPGVSGNPAGRPKRRPSLQTVLLEELASPAPASQSQPATTKLHALAKALVASAIAGNGRAQTLLVGVLMRLDQSEEEVTSLGSDDREILETYLRNTREPIAEESETNRSVSENNEQQR